MVTPEHIKDKNGIVISATAEDIHYPETGHDSLFSIEQNSFWLNHRNKVIQAVLNRFSFENNFADVGGGNGFQLKNISEGPNMSDKTFFLIEPGMGGCMNARKRGIDNVYNMHFEEFDFAGNNIDGVSLFDVIEHIEDDVKFLADLKSKLKKGARIYITVPSHNYLWSDVDDYGKHFRRYSHKMVKKLAENTGLNLLYFSYFFSYLIPISFALRSIPYKFGLRRSDEEIQEAEVDQHMPKGITKAVFGAVESWELKRISKGHLKTGASCIFVLEHS